MEVATLGAEIAEIWLLSQLTDLIKGKFTAIEA